MTDSVPPRPPAADGSRPTVLLGDVTASSVTAWSVLGELAPLPPMTGADDSRQLWRSAPAAPPLPVGTSRRSGPESRQPESRQPGSRQSQSGQSQSGQSRDRQPQARPRESREQGQQREQQAQRDRQVVAQRARDEDLRQRQVRPDRPAGSRPGPRPVQRIAQGPDAGRRPGQGRPAQAPGRPAQSTVAWTAQPTARGAPQRSTSSGPGGRVGPPASPPPRPGARPGARPGVRPGAGPRSERSRVSPVRIVGLVVVVIVLAGRCLNGLT